MFACLHNPTSLQELKALCEVAHQFSPEIEAVFEDTVLFDISPLRQCLGSPNQIASEICRCGHEHDLECNLALAGNPDSAVLLARNRPGVILVTPGQEQYELAQLPVNVLFALNPNANPDLLLTFQKWGLRTCGHLAELSLDSVSERLGPEGVYLHQLACGRVHRPLQIVPAATDYEMHQALEHPLSLIEPLLFLLGSALHDLCEKLRSQFMAARGLKLHMMLDKGRLYDCVLEFPIPLSDARTLLKLLQLHLDRHAPEAAVQSFQISLNPVRPRRVQNDFFMPPIPLPDQLELTLARIRSMVGTENVSTPVLLDTHRPDVFGETTLDTGELKKPYPMPEMQPSVLRLAIRLFRPALPALVQVAKYFPRKVAARSIKGKVLHWAGPWKTSGEWWTDNYWSREEWDVALDDGGLYRIYQEAANKAWYVQGVYD
jgi:protein ImuB